MIEMAYCLPYKYEDHTTAVLFIDAQLEKINAHASLAREQDRLEMIRILHAACAILSRAAEGRDGWMGGRFSGGKDT